MENTWGSDNARAVRLYEKYGFVGMRDEMELPEEAWDAG